MINDAIQNFYGCADGKLLREYTDRMRWWRRWQFIVPAPRHGHTNAHPGANAHTDSDAITIIHCGVFAG